MSLKQSLLLLNSNIAKPVISRFAPSPSGELHLGHLASAIYVWGVTKALNGKVILRIEDHDRQRSRAINEQRIIEILDWLGFHADLGCNLGTLNISTPFRQSCRTDRYQEVVDELFEKNLLYYCDCSRQQIIDRAGGLKDDELKYDGFCRDRKLVKANNHGLRCKMYNQEFKVYDYFLGYQEQNPSIQCGDLLIKDRHNNWTYQFAVVVDDFDQNVNLVIRGQDLTHAIGRQYHLYQLIGGIKPPKFFHHPLIMDPETQKKLSKKDLSTSLNELREQGFSVENLIGDAALKVGLITEYRSMSFLEVMSLFSLK